jgi:hypothetical protein
MLFKIVASLALLTMTANAFAVDAKCENEGKLLSLSYGVPTRMKFTNNSGSVKLVYWIDYVGERVLRSTLKPKESYYVDTYLTHPWVITSASEKCVGVYLPKRLPSSVSIK